MNVSFFGVITEFPFPVERSKRVIKKMPRCHDVNATFLALKLKMKHCETRKECFTEGRKRYLEMSIKIV